MDGFENFGHVGIPQLPIEIRLSSTNLRKFFSDYVSTRLEFRSVLGNKLALSKDALNHIMGRHGELEAIHDLVNEIGKTIEQPDFVILGFFGEHLAIRRHRGR